MSSTVPQPLRVVVIDDEPHVRNLTRIALERSGVASVVGEADGSPEEVAAVCALDPDVILLDQNLGRVRGTELIGSLTRQAPTAMVAMLTVMDPAHEEAGALSAGAFVFYEKSMITGALPQYLVDDHELFRNALEGREVFAPSAIGRRPDAGTDGTD